MLNLFIYIISVVVLIFIILILSYHNKNYKPDYEKLSAYECGFEPFGDARSFFDIHFFTIGLIFLIFDLEVFFLVPFVVQIYDTTFFEFLNLSIFLIFIVIGLAFEWQMGLLSIKPRMQKLDSIKTL